MTRRLALAAIAVAAIVAILLLTVAGQGPDPYLVQVKFRDANGLRTNSLVEVAGHPVGRVRDLSLDDHEVASAVLVLDEAAPIGAGASAKIRPANILGEKYVDLRRGKAASRPLPSGATIPLARTGAPVELDDVLNVLNAPTRVALAVLINESGKALTGRGADFSRLLQGLPPALDQTEQLVGDLGADTKRLGELLEQSDRVVADISAHRPALAALVTNASNALAATAAHSRRLGQTVQEAPGTLQQLRGSLLRLQSASRPLGTASEDLRRAAPSLAALLAQLPPFVDAARPTLRTATRVAPSLVELGQRATPVLKRLRTVTPSLTTFAQTLRSFSAGLEQGAPDTLAAAEGWARAIQVRDAAGHLFRNDAGFTSDALVAIAKAIAPPLANTTKTSPRKSLPDRVKPPPSPVGEGRVPKPPIDSPAPVKNAVDRVQAILDYLLK